MASITKLPSGAYRVQIRRKSRYASETFLRRDDAHRWARQAETRVDQGLAPNKSSVSRLQTFGDLIDLHITDMCEVGKPPRRSKAATLTMPKRDLGKEWIGHLDRQKLIDYGKMRADQGAGPVTLGIDIGVIKMIIPPVAAARKSDGGTRVVRLQRPCAASRAWRRCCAGWPNAGGSCRPTAGCVRADCSSHASTSVTSRHHLPTL